MIEMISASIVPAVVALCGFLILISKKPLFDTFISGAKRGFSTSVELFPTLCVLFCGVSMLQNCGFTDLASKLLTKIGIPDGLAPFLLLRPISGAASTAMLADPGVSRDDRRLRGRDTDFLKLLCQMKMSVFYQSAMKSPIIFLAYFRISSGIAPVP